MNSIDEKSFDILFVEDEEAIRQNYVRYLKRHFHEVYEAADGLRAYEIYQQKKPHILIVDINLPKMNGLELVRKIRQKDHGTKVIMLTAHSDTSYLLEATELKLTKYLVKPVTRDELSGALKLAIRELSHFEVASKLHIILRDSFVWDCDRKELLYKNTEVVLTNKERKVLALLLSNPNATFSYDDIIFDVWYDTSEDRIDALKTIIKNLRKKLPKDSIKNVFGVGYKIELH
ncbi:MAG: response regulator transcription factor [Sulfurimonas sp.]|jgi:DNA-binding response OmpR family regulator|nr:response regulator transcription factor [Sulfurimonas sp.]